MGSPVSPIVAYLYMEYFEQKALGTAPTPRLWWRYVDDTFVIQKVSTNRTSYNTLIVLTLPSSLQWRTTRRMVPSPSWTPLLNQMLMGICITVYRKATHMDPFLKWDSYHHLSAKFSIFNILTHRAQTVCSNPELLHKEMDHHRKALTQCKYPKWALDKVEKRLNRPSREVTDGANNQGTTGAQLTTNKVRTKGHIVIHRVSVKATRRSVGGMAYRPSSKVLAPSRTYWSPPKDTDPMVSKSGAIFWFQYSDLASDEEYLGEPPGP